MTDSSAGDEPRRSRRPLRRRLAIVAAVCGTALLLPLGWYHVWVQPGAAIVRAAFESAPAVIGGPGVPLHRPAVVRELGIAVAVDGAPDTSMDVYHGVGAGPRPLVLWLHGGGFVAHDAASVAGYATVLADAGYTVVAVDYTLSPEAQHPVALRQANAALHAVVTAAADYGVDAASVFIGGDSAGANIAAELGVALTTPGAGEARGLVPAIDAASLRGAILFCGLYDMSTVASTRFPALRTFLWAYTGHRDWMDAPDIDQLSTMREATAAFPSTLLAVGEADPLAPQTHELAAGLSALGVEVRMERAPGAGHEYQFDFRRDDARQTLQQTLDFLAERSEDES